MSDVHMEQGNRVREGLLLVLLAGFAAGFLALSSDYNPTAALFPRLVAIVSLLLVIALVVQQLRPQGSSPGGSAQTIVAGKGAQSPVAVFAFQGVYLLLIYTFGFFCATLFFLFMAPLQMGYRRWRVLILESAFMTFALAGSFLWLLNVPLPAGVIWALW